MISFDNVFGAKALFLHSTSLFTQQLQQCCSVPYIYIYTYISRLVRGYCHKVSLQKSVDAVRQPSFRDFWVHDWCLKAECVVDPYKNSSICP